MNVGRKNFRNRIGLAEEIDSTDDFLNSYTYDALNRLTRVDQVEQACSLLFVAENRGDFSDNPLGQFASIARFNDTDGGRGDEAATSSYTYDTLGRLTDLVYKNGGTNLFTYQTDEAYTYDANGNRTMSGYTTGGNNQLAISGCQRRNSPPAERFFVRHP